MPPISDHRLPQGDLSDTLLRGEFKDKLWRVPALALALPPALLLIHLGLWQGGRYDTDMLFFISFGLSFYAAPIVGALVLVGVLAVRLFGLVSLRELPIRRALLLACLAVASPIWLVVLVVFLIRRAMITRLIL